MSIYRAFASTIQGANHIKNGKECQDYSNAVDSTPSILRFLNKPISIAVVADGHGGDDYFRSALGSQFASESAILGIYQFIKIKNKVKKNKSNEDLLRDLIKNIITTWHGKVIEHFNYNPFSADELQKVSEKNKEYYLLNKNIHHAYGTTLIAVAITEEYCFGIHIGDGRCVVLNKDGSFCQPIPWDDRCFLNSTTSICDDDAAERARIYFSTDLPTAIFIGSDGVDDSYPVDSYEKYLYRFYRTLFLTFFDKGFNAAYAELQEALPSFSLKGSGDDVSIAGFIDFDGMKKTAEILKQQLKIEKGEQL
jgi:hypothetical protein